MGQDEFKFTMKLSLKCYKYLQTKRYMRTNEIILVSTQKRRTDISESTKTTRSSNSPRLNLQSNNKNLIRTSGRMSIYRNYGLPFKSTFSLNCESILKSNESTSLFSLL